MDAEQVKSVSIYFVEPIEEISVIINALISLEFEAYMINDSDKTVLIDILHENPRNIIFFCIKHKAAIDEWFDYVKSVKKVQGENIQLCAFVFDRMEKFERNKFLMEGVAVIEFSEIMKNTMQIMKKILLLFEARGRRPYIKTETYGVSDVYFHLQNFKDPIIGKIKFISVYAFTCEIQPAYAKFFEIGLFINETLLVLNGMRIRTSLKIMGFNKEKPHIFMFKFCTAMSYEKSGRYLEQTNPDIKKKLHEYIKWCLKEKISLKLRNNK